MQGDVDDAMNPDASVSTIWMTGLSTAGKTTLARELGRLLRERDVRVSILDGDEVRKGLCRDLGYTEAVRRGNIRRTAEVARLMNRAGITTICALISPREEDRRIAKAIIGAEHFVEVYVSTPQEVCEVRDPKGLYRLARRGELAHFTGVDAPYEPPQGSHVAINTCVGSPQENALRLFDAIRNVLCCNEAGAQR